MKKNKHFVLQAKLMKHYGRMIITDDYEIRGKYLLGCDSVVYLQAENNKKGSTRVSETKKDSLTLLHYQMSGSESIQSFYFHVNCADKEKANTYVLPAGILRAKPDGIKFILNLSDDEFISVVHHPLQIPAQKPQQSVHVFQVKGYEVNYPH